MAKKKTFELPDWINQEDWQGYLEMRRTIKKPMTELAMKMAVTMLTNLREEGHDPNIALKQSVFMSWQKIYAPRADILATCGIGSTLRKYLTQRKQEGKQPLDADSDAALYMQKTKLPGPFLNLAWIEFKNQYCKRQSSAVSADWPQMFCDAIKSNRYKLWYVDQTSGEYKLSGTGMTAQNVETGAVK